MVGDGRSMLWRLRRDVACTVSGCGMAGALRRWRARRKASWLRGGRKRPNERTVGKLGRWRAVRAASG